MAAWVLAEGLVAVLVLEHLRLAVFEVVKEVARADVNSLDG